MNIITLEISSFTGISLGATHYYGMICFEDMRGNLVKHELEYKISTSEAKRLNKIDGGGWKAEMTTSRFESKGAVIQSAIEWFQKHFPKQDAVLVIGRYTEATRKQVILSTSHPELVGKFVNRNGHLS